MANLALWNLVSELKSEKYKWVDLTHELSPETPHWYGFNPLEAKLLFDYVEGTPEDMMAPMRCFQVSVAMWTFPVTSGAKAVPWNPLMSPRW